MFPAVLSGLWRGKIGNSTVSLQVICSSVFYLVFVDGIRLTVRQCNSHHIPVLMLLPGLSPQPSQGCVWMCVNMCAPGSGGVGVRICTYGGASAPLILSLISHVSTCRGFNLIYAQRGNLPVKHTHTSISLSPPFTVCPISVFYKASCVLDQRRREDAK